MILQTCQENRKNQPRKIHCAYFKKQKWNFCSNSTATNETPLTDKKQEK